MASTSFHTPRLAVTLFGALLFVAPLFVTMPAAAQQNPGWFVPNAPGPAAARPAPTRPAPRVSEPRQQMQPPPPMMQGPIGAPPVDQAEVAPIDVPLPAPPEIPALAKGVAPPGAVIGVLGVPEVMHASTAAQQVERTIGERREKLSADAQKEQLAWRDLQQAAQQAVNAQHLSPEQVRGRERELQDRITNAQKSFRDRNTLIQQAAQYSLGQIERTLIVVIRQVAESRNMNLVLHRSQVALNVNDFDITQSVADVLNKVLPAVLIPADGVPLAEWAKKQNLAQATPKPVNLVSGAPPPPTPTPAVTAPTPAPAPAPATGPGH